MSEPRPAEAVRAGDRARGPGSRVAYHVRLQLLRERAAAATAHAQKLGEYLQRKLDEGSEPTWYTVREFDRRYDAMLAALAEVAAAEAELAGR